MKENIKSRLQQMAEPNYRDFSSALIPNCTNMLGVRLPKLRTLAKEIALNSETYFAEPCGDSFEEIMLRGMVIGCMKCSTTQRMQYIREFIPLITNWSVCDSFCTGLKEAKQKPQEYWDFIQPYFSSESEFAVRFSTVMLLAHFSRGEWLPRTLEQLEHISHTGYYVKMSVGWAISVCYVHNPAYTWNWIQHTQLDSRIQRIAVRKILDSRRVTGQDRERILSIRQH